MKKTLLFAALAFSLSLFLEAGPLQAAGGKSLSMPGQEITIAGKKPARFDHAGHAALKLDCGVCHHGAGHQPLTAADIAAKTDAGELRCLSCHNSGFPKKELRESKDIFHTRCKDCHSKGINGTKGPTRCADCHITPQPAGKKIEGC